MRDSLAIQNLWHPWLIHAHSPTSRAIALLPLSPYLTTVVSFRASRSRLIALATGALLGWFLRAGLAAESTNVSKYKYPESLAGRILSADRKKVLFNFTRKAIQTGSRLDVLREFTTPEGVLAEREKVVYVGDELTDFQLEQLQINTKEVARIRADPDHAGKRLIAYEYTKDTRSTAKPKTRTESLRPETLISDMLAPWFLAHWQELLRGEEIRCRYIVPQRRETIGFSVEKQSDFVRDGRKYIHLKMSPSSIIISALVDPLIFTIEGDGARHVLEYTGRTTLKLKEGNDWKDLTGVTVFDWPK